MGRLSPSNNTTSGPAYPESPRTRTPRSRRDPIYLADDHQPPLGLADLTLPTPHRQTADGRPEPLRVSLQIQVKKAGHLRSPERPRGTAWRAAPRSGLASPGAPPRTPQRVPAPGPHTFTPKPQRTLMPSRLRLDDAPQSDRRATVGTAASRDEEGGFPWKPFSPSQARVVGTWTPFSRGQAHGRPAIPALAR